MARINLFDKTLKIIARDYAGTFLRLALPNKEFRLVGTLENVELTLPEERVDFVHELDYEGAEYILHFEFQLKYKRDFPKRVFVYSAELTRLFDKPVISVVLYLKRREYQFPGSYCVCIDSEVVNSFTYSVLKLWDYEDEIRSGELREFAPLLPLIVEEPTLETLEEERALILQEEDDGKRARLLASAVTIASRFFDRDFLWEFFREEVEQMQRVSFIQEWIEEAEKKGLQKGRIDTYKETVATLLEDKFGIIKPDVLDALEKVNQVENLKALVRKAPKVKTQDEFLELVKFAAGE